MKDYINIFVLIIEYRNHTLFANITCFINQALNLHRAIISYL